MRLATRIGQGLVKKGGALLAIILAISGILRVAGPGSASTPPSEAQEKKKPAQPAKPVTTTYPDELRNTIEEFYGVWTEDEAAEKKVTTPWNVPEGSGANVRFVIAILPDPVHTHLALTFDRGIEALQQAAQRMGYRFDRAILPWDVNPSTPPDDLDKRQTALQEQRERESYPGLLIFREGAKHREKREEAEGEQYENDPHRTPPECHEEPLFVLVVGESPTGGLRKHQFFKALQMMNSISGGAGGKSPLRILGPTFSGSLQSLDAALRVVSSHQPERKIYVYSGSVTDSESIKRFSGEPFAPYFSSFQENDDYARDQFIQFACSDDYWPHEIATLSEDETVFGSLSAPKSTSDGSSEKASRGRAEDPAELPACKNKHPGNGNKNKDVNEGEEDLVRLHFPREISYFRTAYQKQITAQQKPDVSATGAGTLQLDLQEARGDDDSVAPYATAQNPLSQEAVMRGILSELQKHGIKFTILYASDPADQLFLARYLRTGYPQGRVVITDPDLLFSREDDTLLRGVIGISAYALVPGLSDRLNPWHDSSELHRDHLFVSDTSVGTFNAMLGLLSVTGDPGNTNVPLARYDSYGIPWAECSTDINACQARPVLWLTILGRDGFWPLVGLASADLHAADKQLPVAFLGDICKWAESTLKPVKPPPHPLAAEVKPPHPLPGAWKIAYWLCLLAFMIHTFLSWTGSILSDSEASTQFARTPEWRDAVIVALGALALATAFVVIMFIKSPIPFWGQGYLSLWIVIEWVAFPVFVGATLWDLSKFREKRYVALFFAVALTLIVCWQILAWCLPPAWPHWLHVHRISVYWSTRVPHLSSGLSPALPVLLLLGAGYWWMWQSLRGVTLVDLRRPRLPQKADLGPFSYRLSEIEADELRMAAHPVVFTRRVWVMIVLLLVVTLTTVLDWGHPVQTVEGDAYDWGYALLLGLMIAAFLICLFKLVWTWSKCSQILAGLDRLPLREAFSRMQRLSWRSMWNPGGSTLRETYKLMSRGIENLTRLKSQIQDWRAPLTDAARRRAIDQIDKITTKREDALKIYARIVADEKEVRTSPDDVGNRSVDLAGWVARAAFFLRIRLFPEAAKERHRKCQEKSDDLLLLMKSIETIQGEMARMTARLICEVLKPLWDEESAAVVSEDKRIVTTAISPLRVLAEEYCALTYVNFLVTVLLRMRTMVICAIGMYVFLVISMNVYPFEPHPALQTLAIVLLLLLGAVVAYVYAEMHREAILSRLTSTGTGELGWDFWLKLASAGAIPVFSLLAVQFPAINQFLFSWLEPALQAVK